MLCAVRREDHEVAGVERRPTSEKSRRDDCGDRGEGAQNGGCPWYQVYESMVTDCVISSYGTQEGSTIA